MRTKQPLAFSSLVILVCAGFLTVILGLTLNAAPAKADVIYHAFDECFANVTTKLPEIQAVGLKSVPVPHCSLSKMRLKQSL